VFVGDGRGRLGTLGKPGLRAHHLDGPRLDQHSTKANFIGADGVGMGLAA
jgi:hypothetical protein